jgi:hypothetical protein
LAGKQDRSASVRLSAARFFAPRDPLVSNRLVIFPRVSGGLNWFALHPSKRPALDRLKPSTPDW